MGWGRALWASCNSRIRPQEDSCQIFPCVQSDHEPVAPLPPVEPHNSDFGFYIPHTHRNTRKEPPLHCHVQIVSSTCMPAGDISLFTSAHVMICAEYTWQCVMNQEMMSGWCNETFKEGHKKDDSNVATSMKINVASWSILDWSVYM